MVKKRGILNITPELLLDALHIEGRIVDIRFLPFEGERIEVLIEKDNLPECPEGAYAQGIELKDCLKPIWRD